MRLFYSFRSFIVLLVCSLSSIVVMAQKHLSGEIILQTNRSIDQNALSEFFSTNQLRHLTEREKGGYQVSPISEISHFYHITFNAAQYNEDTLLQVFSRQSWVLAAQYNHILEMRGKTPNDPRYQEQWAMTTIQAPAVWSQITGGKTACGDEIVVALFDVGTDVKHEDLIDNIWHNTHEIPNNGIDDDGNGYIDDYNGWNFTANNDSITYNANHGTYTAGVIGAKGNNGKGIAGVNWNVKIMVLGDIRGTEAGLMAAYSYATDMRRRYNQSGGKQGAFVAATSMSLGLDNTSVLDHQAWCNLYDTLGMQGIINVIAATDGAGTVEAAGDIPSLCPSKYKIVVTSTDVNENLAQAYSSTKVALGAPGENVLLTKPGNGYTFGNGTSFACPLVAGAVALLYNVPYDSLCRTARTNPVSTADRLTNDILKGVDLQPSLQGKTITGGRLNLFGAYNQVLSDFGTKVGTEDVANVFAHIQLYPNPVLNGTLIADIRLTEAQNASVEITNTLGQTVYEEKLSGGNLYQRLSLSLNGIPTGMYFFSVVGQSGAKITTKIVVGK